MISVKIDPVTAKYRTVAQCSKVFTQHTPTSQLIRNYDGDKNVASDANIEIKGIRVRHARSWESKKSGRQLDRKSSVPNGNSITTEFLLTSDTQQLFVKTQDFDLFVVVHARTCSVCHMKVSTSHVCTMHGNARIIQHAREHVT
jgi:hypothetical protein